ncbi:Cystathionine beta-synthase, core domain protein, partial [mine drainage metagenome]
MGPGEKAKAPPKLALPMPSAWPTASLLMSPDVVTTTEDAPISQAIGLMRSRSIHELPVLRRRKYLGLITFETIARRANLPLSTKVGHLLILPPVVTPSTGYADLAEQLLASGLRAAPVADDKGRLVGIVSRTDLIREFPVSARSAAPGSRRSRARRRSSSRRPTGARPSSPRSGRSRI